MNMMFNKICILLLCENCINLNYVELIHSDFQVCCVFLLFYIFFLLIFEHLILKLQLKILIYLLRKLIVICENCSVMSNSVTPWTIQSMEFSRPEYWSRQPFPSPGDLPNPGIKPRSPAVQADSSAEPQGKPKNTGVGSLSLLQRIFLTQESNWALLLCRQTLYQPSYQGLSKKRIF